MKLEYEYKIDNRNKRSIIHFTTLLGLIRAYRTAKKKGSKNMWIHL